VVEAGEVEEAVEEEDAEFGFERVVEVRGLAGGGIERDGEVAGMLVSGGEAGHGLGGEAEDVGGLVLATEGAIEAFELGVGGEEDVDVAPESESGAGAVKEARQRGPGGRGVFGIEATRGVDGDHFPG